MSPLRKVCERKFCYQTCLPKKGRTRKASICRKTLYVGSTDHFGKRARNETGRRAIEDSTLYCRRVNSWTGNSCFLFTAKAFLCILAGLIKCNSEFIKSPHASIPRGVESRVSMCLRVLFLETRGECRRGLHTKQLWEWLLWMRRSPSKHDGIAAVRSESVI